MPLNIRAEKLLIYNHQKKYIYNFASEEIIQAIRACDSHIIAGQAFFNQIIRLPGRD